MLNLNHVKTEVLSWLKPIGDMQLEGLKNGDLNTQTKATTIDYLTDYDLKSEAMLIEQINRHYPDHDILAEEGGNKQLNSDYRWVIDPIDGTTNYAHGFPFFCISVGLQHRGEIVLGIVYAPMLDYTFSAVKGQGAFLNDRPISVSTNQTLQRSLVSTGFPYLRATDNMNIPYFLKVVNHVSGIRRCGSAALDLCMVAAGMIDAYWEFCLNEWDVCAGTLIVTEAGGAVEQISVDAHTMLLSSNGHIHAELTARLFE